MMISHTYHLRLESNVIRLDDVEDLLGKEVEVTVREIDPSNVESNFEALNNLLNQKASAEFFKKINDASEW